MRIIAGFHRGRAILPPEGTATRPITDRVKQSLFDRLAAAERVEGAVVLDLFAGTGSLGLECLSRGAAHVTFVEQDRSAAEILEKNLEMFREESKSRVVRSNALGGAIAMSLPRRDYSLLFVDPPYPMVADRSKAARLWSRMEELAAVCQPGTWMVLRLERHEQPPAVGGWSEPQSFNYGSMTLHLFKRRGE